MRILIIANAPRKTERWAEEMLSDRGVETAAAGIAAALKRRGISSSIFLVADRPEPLLKKLREFSPDAVFNLCETLGGNSRLEPTVPFLLGWLNIPITGNTPQVLSLLVDKVLTKHVLRSAKIPTPEFLPLFSEKDLDGWKTWPAFLKPAAEDASLGIDEGSIVRNAKAAKTRFRLLAKKFGTPVLMEKFIPGREINAAVLQTSKGLKIAYNEIDFTSLPPSQPAILTYRAKWVEDSEECIKTPAKPLTNLAPGLERKIRTLASQAFELFGLRGYARVDFRVTPEGKPFVLEINPNPDLTEGAGFSKSLPAMGLTYDAAIETIVRTSVNHR